MRKKTFSEEQIALALRQAETGTPVTEVCRKMGVSEQSFYRWKKKYMGMGIGIAELRRLRQLEEENRKLKKIVADLTLDKHMHDLMDDRQTLELPIGEGLVVHQVVAPDIIRMLGTMRPSRRAS